MDSSPAARVLLVEDDDGNAADYQIWLADGGHTVARAKAASDALELAASFAADVVLLDMQIPSVPRAADADIAHGLRTLDELVRVEPFRPVVIVTALNPHSAPVRNVRGRTPGTPIVFKGDKNLEHALLEAVAIAMNQRASHSRKAAGDPHGLAADVPAEDANGQSARRNGSEAQ